MSWVWAFTLWASASTSRAWARDDPGAPFSSRLVIESAMGGPAAMVSTSASTVPASSAAGTAALTSPSSAASVPLRVLAVKASSLALWAPMRWRSSHEVPKSRLSPRLAKMAENRAVSAHQAVVDGQHGLRQDPHGVDHRRLGARAPAAAAVAGQVGAGAEVPVRPGQEHGSGAREGDVPERRPQRHPHVAGAGVLGGRVVERDPHDVALALDPDVGVVGPHVAA
jgi:hypothetical protein